MNLLAWLRKLEQPSRLRMTAVLLLLRPLLLLLRRLSPRPSARAGACRAAPATCSGRLGKPCSRNRARQRLPARVAARGRAASPPGADVECALARLPAAPGACYGWCQGLSHCHCPSAVAAGALAVSPAKGPPARTAPRRRGEHHACGAANSHARLQMCKMPCSKSELVACILHGSRLLYR